MKIDAEVKITKDGVIQNILIPFDTDYVYADESEIIQNVNDEIWHRLGINLNDDEFQITNMSELLDELDNQDE